MQKDHDPKIPKNKNNTDNVDTAYDTIVISEEKADLPEQNAESVERQAPRRSSRRSVGSLETVKVIRMGGVESKPINATIQLCNCSLEGKGRHKGSGGALNSSRLGRQGQDTGTRKMGHVRCSNGTRREGQGKGAGSDSLNVTRYCQSYGRLNRTQGMGSGRSSGSLGLGSTSGNMTQGSGPRGSSGPIRMRQTAGVTGSRGVHLKPVIEVITVSDSDDEEDLEKLEENLRRMAARRNGRRYVDTNRRVHSNKAKTA